MLGGNLGSLLYGDVPVMFGSTTLQDELLELERHYVYTPMQYTAILTAVHMTFFAVKIHL